MHHAVRASRTVAFGVIVLIGCLCSGCHSGEAMDGCDELAQRLYKARQSGERSRIEDVLRSADLSTEGREALVSRIVERERTYGFQKSRRRYLSNASLQRSGFPDEHYSVRTGYNLVYPNGTTWEEIVCRTDTEGRHPAIIDLTLGPFSTSPPAEGSRQK
jgi:hypothetical protein